MSASLSAYGSAVAAASNDTAKPAAKERIASYNGVFAMARDDVWVVGETGDPLNHGARTLAKHWDGSTWTRERTENPGGEKSSQFFDVSADSADDAWAVGDFEPDYGYWATVGEHWDGNSWRTVPTPIPGRVNQAAIVGVAAVSPTSAFAVMNFPDVFGGVQPSGAYSGHDQRGWAIAWNGEAWRSIYLTRANRDTSLVEIDADSATDVWAVGSTYGRAHQPKLLAAHWDGAEWSVPALTTAGTRLAGVSVLSPTDVWAVGWGAHAVALHWDGSRWEDESPGVDGRLINVCAVSADDVWAVGTSGDGHPLTMHWDGSGWLTVDFPGGGVLSDVSGVAPNDVWAVGTIAGDSYRPLPVLGHWDGRSWSVS